MAHSAWIEPGGQENNWFLAPGGNEERGIADEPWMVDIIEQAPGREGDYTTQEIPFSGLWGLAAAACAAAHALWGDRVLPSYMWDGNCPILVTGLADEVTGGSSVSYFFNDSPEEDNLAHMEVRTRAWGLYPYLAKLNLPERGVNAFPDPEADGFPADSEIEWEAPTVTIVGASIADAGGSAVDGDPESYYGVNYTAAPQKIGGDWIAWQKGFLPGPRVGDVPGTLPSWADDVDAFAFTFPSEGVDLPDKTYYPLVMPEDDEDLAHDTDSPPDHTVIAGPAEAFDEKAFTASRSASAQIVLKIFVQSPRYRWIYTPDVSVIPPRRIVGRPGDGLVGPARVFGGGSTVQTGRLVGGIL